MKPPGLVSRPRESFVEYIQIKIAVAMGRATFKIDVPTTPIVDVAHDRQTIEEVPRVETPLSIECHTVYVYMAVAPILEPNGAAAFLKVAAPSKPLRGEWCTIRQNVRPAVVGLHRSSLVVEAPSLQEPSFIGWLATVGNVVAPGLVAHRCKTGSMVLLHSIKPTGVQGAALDKVMRQVWCDCCGSPLLGVVAFGRRILHV